MPNGRTKKGKAKAAQNRAGRTDEGLAGVQKSYPNYSVRRVKNTSNSYTLTDKNGHTATLTRGKAKNPVKKYTPAQVYNMSQKKSKK